MKLYMFQSGWIRTKKHLLVKGPETDAPFEAPVPFFLILHPGGNVLFDTGQPMSAVNYTTCGNYIPVMRKADYVAEQLKKVGLKTTDITHIVLSHLHSDHAGGLEAFSAGTCYVQEKELQYGNNHIIIHKYPGFNWCLLKGDRDIFGDDMLRIISTPGHTCGHQSLLLKLGKQGGMLLTADAVYTEEILDNNIMPGVFHNREASIETIERTRQMRRQGVIIITGHDPQAWSKFKLAPDYYE